jgi:two-component system, NarL family, sensor kinase
MNVGDDLELQSAYLSALLEHSPIAIVSLDSDHNVQACNPAFEKLFKYTRAELMNGSLEQMIASQDSVPEAVDIWRRVVQGEKVFACSKRKRKDGTLFDVEIHGIPLMVRGRLRRVYGIYHDISEQKRAETSLRRLSASLLHVQDEERRRIARNLHETTIQTLVALTMNLSQLKAMIGPAGPGLENLIADTVALAEHSVREVRTVSHLLHPPLLDDVGLASAIRCYVRGFEQRSGIRVTLDMPALLTRMPQELETTLFRILQEALTNIHRHSGSPTADIQLKYNPEQVVLEVRDGGRGMPSEFTSHTIVDLGIGILGMRERIKQLNGQLEILSSERGTLLWVSLPMPRDPS